MTASQNRTEGDRDLAEWLPPRDRCRCHREWVAVGHRRRLSVDGAERPAMRSLAEGCGNPTVTVTLAR